MAPEANRTKIDAWIAESPVARTVEATRDRDRWVTQAIENGALKFEETSFGPEEPRLNLLAAWCARHTKRSNARPLAKADGTPNAKLSAWEAAAPGRKVSQRVRARSGGSEHLCECTEAGAVVALGVGDTREAATRDACDKLWRLALEAAGQPTNPKVRFTGKR